MKKVLIKERGWAVCNPADGWIYDFHDTRVAAIDGFLGPTPEPLRTRRWRRCRKNGCRVVRARIVAEVEVPDDQEKD